MLQDIGKDPRKHKAFFDRKNLYQKNADAEGGESGGAQEEAPDEASKDDPHHPRQVSRSTSATR